MSERAAPWALSALFGVSVALLAPTGTPLRAKPWSTSRPPVLVVESAGCAEVSRGGVCEVEPGHELTLWAFTDPGASLSVDLDGKARTVEWAPHERGFQTRVPVPEGATRLTVEARTDHHTTPFELPLRTRPATRMERAFALRRDGQLAEALKLVEQAKRDGLPEEEAAILGFEARVELRGATRPGDHERALEKLDRAISKHHASGRLTSEMLDRFAATYYRTEVLDNRGGEARQTLENGLPDLDQAPELRAQYRYYDCNLRRRSGATENPLSYCEQARNAGARLSLPIRDDASYIVRELLLATGLYEEALGLVLDERRRLLDSELPPQKRAEIALNVAAQLVLLASKLGPDADLPDALEEAKNALALVRTSGSAALHLSVAHQLLARAELARGHLDLAAAALEESRRASAVGTAEREALWTTTAGEIALGRGRFGEARQHFRGLAETDKPDSPVRWVGHMGLGRVEEAAGNADAARASYERAEDWLDQNGTDIAPSFGRDAYLGDHEESASRLVDLLVRQGDTRAALLRARKSLARGLRALTLDDRVRALPPELRERWEAGRKALRDTRDALDRECGDKNRDTCPGAERERRHAGLTRSFLELLGSLPETAAEWPEPGEDELLLVYHRAPSGDYVVFAASGANVSVTRAQKPRRDASAEELARGLLAPVGAALERARGKRIRLVMPAALESIDFPSLPWAGAPLGTLGSVVHGLDLGRRPAPPAASSAGVLRALIVDSDPRGDLPNAESEGQSVTQSLVRNTFWSSRHLSGNEATAGAVRAALDGAERPLDLFHFAGHARYGGVDGLASALLLADGTALDVADILLLRHPPRVVILSACEGAHAGSNGARGLGIAQAFLLAGSEVVLAPYERVHDGATAAFMKELYGAPAKLGGLDGLEARLSATTLALSAAHALDPAVFEPPAFRLMIPR